MTEPEDLTARPRIREAALLHFGEHGFEGATTRAGAVPAGRNPVAAALDALAPYRLYVARALAEGRAAARPLLPPLLTPEAASELRHALGKPPESG
ncbi:hypothetical protein [Nonomuraea sp. NPDC001831]|uniref:hypothetical protein n=1 Tax=Nonomuraea sp. NPDC001831 TaxID=3364340 RepID=UPI0036C57CA9